jgi:hypothetical protein
VLKKIEYKLAKICIKIFWKYSRELLPKKGYRDMADIEKELTKILG